MSTQLQCSLVIRGETIQYVKDFSVGDYGVVLPNSMVVIEEMIQGVVLGCRGRRASFVIPIAKFNELHVLEHPTVPPTNPMYTPTWTE